MSEKIYIDSLGVYKTLRLIPEGILLLQAGLADLHNAGRGVDTFTALEDRDKKLPKGVAACFDLCLLPGGVRIKNHHILRFIKGLISETDQVGADFSVCFVINTVDRFVAGVCNLADVLGKLDLRNKFSGLFVLDGCQLVHASEGGASLWR